MAKLDQFIFSEDVQLGDVTDTFAQMAVVGPEAARRLVARVLGGVGRPSADSDGAAPNTATCAARWCDGQPAIVTRVTDTGEPGFDVFVEQRTWRRAERALIAAGAVEVDADDRRGDAHRGGRAAVSSRHGRRDDSARGRHRVARDQLHARAATSARKSSSACCTAATAASRGSWSG